VLEVCGFLLVAVAAVFGQTLWHDFVNYDDDQYVYENSHINHGLTPEGIGWVFTHEHMANWHPLTGISHMLDCQLYGLKWVWGHHLSNVVLHAATVILLFLVLLRMTGRLWPSAFVAAVFAVHPLRAESVAWISERKDVLSGLFFMLTLWAYAGYVRKPFSLLRYLGVAVFFALGLMAKPMLVTLPFVLLLLDYWPLGRFEASSSTAGGGGRRVAVRLIVEKLPLVALAVGSCLATVWAQGAAIRAAAGFPLAARLLNATVSYAAYLVQMCWPVGLAPFYPFRPYNAALIGGAAAATLALAGISAAALVWRRRLPYLPVGWLWYLGMLVPVIGLVQVGGQAMADRYTYLPQIGIYLLLAWGACDLTSSWPLRRWVCGAAATAVLAALTVCGCWQTAYWQDSLTLWEHAETCTAPNNILYYNLASAEQRGPHGHDPEVRRKAIQHFRLALEFDPNDYSADNDLAVALADSNKMDEALAHFQRAIQLAPEELGPHKNIADLLSKLGRVDEAIAEYEKALRIDPARLDANNHLAELLVKRGDFDGAILHYQKAIKEALETDPALPVAHLNLGKALAGKGRLDEAIAQYEQALTTDPYYAKAHNNLGTALARRGRTPEALAHLREAVRIDPEFSEAWGNLAWVLFCDGKVDEAVADFRKALQIDPHNAVAMKQWKLSIQLLPGDARLAGAMAWLLATSPQASLRDGAKAVALARRAVRLSGGREAASLDTLAAAYAEAGRFAEAVETAGQARTLAAKHGDRALAEAIEKRLALYRKKVPFRDAPAASAPTGP
jgi:tetratricopeptide (TPR) repeat protein